MSPNRIRILQHLISLNERIFFYPKLASIYRRLLGNRVGKVIDVGVNKGQTIDFFLKMNPDVEVWGYEPNASLFKRLRQKYGNNPRIHLFDAGVSSEKGRMRFFENILDETSSFEMPNLDAKYTRMKAKILGVSPRNTIRDAYDVETTTLAEILNGFDGLVADVLKVDIEGHEYQCFKGLDTLESDVVPVRYIQIERHYNDMYGNKNYEEMEDLLKSYGFEIVEEVGHGLANYHERIYRNIRLS